MEKSKKIVTAGLILLSILTAILLIKVYIIDIQQQHIDELTESIETFQTSQQITDANNIDLEQQIENLKFQINSLDSEMANQKPNINAETVAPYLSKTVKVWCSQEGLESFGYGSGSLISKYGEIFTNQHVVGFLDNLCLIGLTDDPNLAPVAMYYAKVIDIDNNLDLATLQITHRFDTNNSNTISEPFDPTTLDLPSIKKTDYCPRSKVHIGDAINIIGYPSTGGSTITVTEGTVSGFEDLYIKTSAKIEHGNSGGLAVHESGCVLGMPVGVVSGELESLGRIIDFTPFGDKVIDGIEIGD